MRREPGLHDERCLSYLFDDLLIHWGQALQGGQEDLSCQIDNRQGGPWLTMEPVPLESLLTLA